MVMHHIADPPSLLKMLSDKAEKRFCLIQFESDIGPHEKTLESFGWHLDACGKMEFNVNGQYYSLLSQVSIEGVDHEDMPEYHRPSGEGAYGEEGPFKVKMNWYGRPQ